MKEIKVAISAPVDDNIYSLLVTHLCIFEPDVKLVGVYSLKMWSLTRFSSELKRLGSRFLIKIWRRYFSLSNSENASDKSFELLKNKGLDNETLESLCSRHNVPFKYFNDPNDNNTIDFLNENNPDIILSIGSEILKQKFLNVPKIGVLNVHMGILPEYRGIGVTEWPILESDSLNEVKIGITLHLIDKGVDTGPIILKKNINIDSKDTIEKIEDKFLPNMVEAMFAGVKLARDNKLTQTRKDQPSKGKQYYFLHPRLKRKVSEKLSILLNGN